MSVAAPLGIAGVGLIGGSIALRARALDVRVVGFDPDPAGGALVDASADSLAALAAQVQTLILAMPLHATLAAIDELRRLPAEGLRFVFDVASVKGPVVRRARDWTAFVATHPLAGAERSGPGAARADLFSGRSWAYVPADAPRDTAVRSFITAMGARPFEVDADAHDRAVALTSHLPQIVVSTLAAALGDAGAPPEFAGPGLASTLRLAGSPWPLWEPIIRANALTLAVALQDLGKRFGTLAEQLEAGDVTLMASYFETARASYEAFVRSPRD